MLLPGLPALAILALPQTSLDARPEQTVDAPPPELRELLRQSVNDTSSASIVRYQAVAGGHGMMLVASRKADRTTPESAKALVPYQGSLGQIGARHC